MQRPDTVPAEATWDDTDQEWMLAPRDTEGQEHGTVTWWRADGTRCCVTPYVHGTPQGGFQRFHQSGEPSREGVFVDGVLHGTNTFWRSDAATTEVFPPGLAEAVWRCEMDYDQGTVVDARAYDRDGRRVLEDGSPFPDERPAGVPDTAHFRKREADGQWRWVDGSARDNGDGTICRVGVWTFWDEAGALVERLTFVEGVEQGPFERRVDEDRYADPRIVTERGTHEAGKEVGTLELLDEHGSVVTEVTMSAEADQGAIADVLGSLEGLGDGLIASLADRGQRTVAFLGAALAGHDRAALQGHLDALQPPLSDEAGQHATFMAKHVGSNIVRFGGGPVQVLSGLLDGVRNGGDASELLRQAAATIDDMGFDAVAMPLVDAACRLQPDETGLEYTRALVRMSAGDPAGARDSVLRLATEVPEAAGMLGAYRNALFADLTAPLSADPRLALAEEVGALLPRAARETAPPAAVVRRALQQAATRIEHVRDALWERFGEVAWLPPTQERLLPNGPVDVALPDGDGVGLLHAARRDLLRVRWLCWSLGLDGRSLPDTVDIDEERPSRGLGLVVLARALTLEGSEPDVAPWLEDLDEEVRGRIAALLAERAPASTWYGLPLSACDHAARQFAFDDELALFRMLVQWWNESDGGTWYDVEAAAA